jgi:hypothetical protein
VWQGAGDPPAAAREACAATVSDSFVTCVVESGKHATQLALRKANFPAFAFGTSRAHRAVRRFIMRKSFLGMFATLALLGNFALLGLSACAHEGPAERTGRHIDNAADEVKHDAKKAAKGD